MLGCAPQLARTDGERVLLADFMLDRPEKKTVTNPHAALWFRMIPYLSTFALRKAAHG